ncbi:MAG TPA: ABC transporter permease [Candidatus Omnitrophota bacterium]|nr:ABC transporter permease [Candidatus Omnitrophota bacterium]
MIEIKNIHKTYTMGKVEVKALDGVSLKIDDGEFVAIMGASGSGKSTLMHILGLLDRPDAGQYLLRGQDVTALSDEALAVVRNGLIGFVFQQFHLLPRMSALENAELPLVYAGKRHLREKARAELAGVGLQDRVLHRPSELSGGQQQRVAIARSLVNDPVMLLADEPTGNLDSRSKAEIIAILKQLNARGKTVVIVTHEPEVAQQTRRIITMRDGKVIADAKNVPAGGSAVSAVTPESGSTVKDLLAERHRVAGKIKFLDYVRQALSAMISHKMRSILSILGILIGVAAVIAMLALGTGAKVSIEQQLQSLGSNLLWLHPAHGRSGAVALESTATRFTQVDIDLLARLPHVKRVYGSVTARAQVVYGSNNTNTQVEGTGTEYPAMRAATPVAGRFFTEQEMRAREKVALLGTTVLTNLFGEANPVGETIKINLINFKVIGVLPSKGSGGFRDQDDTVIVPLTTAMYRVFGKQYIDSIYVEAVSAGDIDAAQEEVRRALNKQHRLKADDTESVDIRNMSEIKSTLESTMKTLTMLLGSIAAISLLVGGIGIMNIMLVSVTERTREIGLRKAIGANNKDIMMQFLIEAVLMSFIGGIVGIVLGAGASVVMKLAAGWAVQVSLFSIVLATVFSLIVGVVFGLWPASQAAKLNPIEALRYE